VTRAEVRVLRIAVDLLWWTAERAWTVLRTLSGDDAYERYLATVRVQPLSRREFYDRRVRQHWERQGACGRCFDADDRAGPVS